MSDASESKEERRLVGAKNFVRHNPMSDKFTSHKFHHVELYCTDATNVSHRWCWGMGYTEVAKSDMSTGNNTYASYVMQSLDSVFVFTAPYNNPDDQEGTRTPHPHMVQDEMHDFVRTHGVAVRAIGILVDDAATAYRSCVESGGQGVLEPTVLEDQKTGTSLTIAEVRAYGDVVFRWVSGDYEGPFLPGYVSVDRPPISYGLERVDHIVGNVPRLFDVTDYLMGMTGWHEFAEFTAEDVGTLDSGLNSMVVSSNDEMILLPINEPTFGTPRKSQIQTYLEQNNGPGAQHIALKTDNIFDTMRELRKREHCGGFEFMPAPDHGYYERLVERIGEDALTADQLRELEELGLLADKDDQGVLLQVFTKPIGDRLTLFIEIIQRVGCDVDGEGNKISQKPGCGGFGKGNFGELFKSIEEYEKQIDASRAQAEEEA
jgi:4-hydroxyphenylpyruvate dioxygenase